MTDYTKLVKALRKVADFINCYDCDMWGLGECDTESKSCVLHDAADAIEALQAEIRESMQRCAECGDELAHQMPKRGKWIVHTEVKNIYGGICVECPVCRDHFVVLNVSDEKYCRSCGAKMTEVQDG